MINERIAKIHIRYYSVYHPWVTSIDSEFIILLTKYQVFT